jgi:cholinesterase
VFGNYTKLANAGKFAKVPILVGDNIDEACSFLQLGKLPKPFVPVANDLVFTCPAIFAARYRAAAEVPAYQYSYAGAYPNLELPACPGKPWHGQDVYVMYNSSEIASRKAATKDEVKMGLYMRKAWSAFAHDPANGLAKTKNWPKMTHLQTEVAVLGANDKKFSKENMAAAYAKCEILYSKS